MTTKRKPQRPRLEVSAKSTVFAECMAPDHEVPIRIRDKDCPGDLLQLTKLDAKRLHRFLTRAIAYLESKSKGLKS